MDLKDKRLYPLYAFIVSFLIIAMGVNANDNSHYYLALVAALLISALTYLYTTD
jgi:hypothetical protein